MQDSKTGCLVPIREQRVDVLTNNNYSIFMAREKIAKEFDAGGAFVMKNRNSYHQVAL
jgi:hypothetical protein